MSGAKKYPASAKKLLKARNDGDVAKSRDLTSALVLNSQLGCLYFFSDRFMNIFSFGREIFRCAAAMDLAAAYALFAEAVNLLYSLALPCLLTGVVVGALSEFLQVGFYFLAANLAPKLSRLDFILGMKRICGIEEDGVSMLLPYRIGKMLFIVVMTAILFWTSLVSLVHNLLNAELSISPEIAQCSTFPLLPGSFVSGFILLELRSESLFFVVACGVFLAILSVFDWFYERRRMSLRLMMDAEELKQEYRDSEGDAQLKHERSRLQRELSEYSRLSDVRKARVVITDMKSV